MGYEFIKRRRSNKEPIYELSQELIAEQHKENEFKDTFMSFLNTQHNLLRGAAVTGDDAFDDILYMLMYCYIQDKFDEEKYNFTDFEISKYSNKSRFEKFVKYIKIDELLKDTLTIRPKKRSECVINKIGTILKNHPTTKALIDQEDFLKCDNRKVIIKCLQNTMKFLEENDITKYQDIVGIAYEYFSSKHGGNGGTSKEMGQYFTERKLMGMTFQLIDEDDLIALDLLGKEDLTIGDEFCATFGYPLYLRKFLKDKFKLDIKDDNMYGIEYHDRLSRMAALNAMFSMKSYRNVRKGDSFRENLTPHLDISVHNVPFGQSMKVGMIKETYNTKREENPDFGMPEFNQVVPIEANVDAILASQVALYKTKNMGLLIIKDGKETTSDSHKDYRKYFCENCNIKKILKIPSGAFSSTGTKTICIYFTKKIGIKTEEIQFLELNQDGTKISEVCNVSIMDLKTKNYSWDPEVYILDETFAKMKEKANCEFVKLGEEFEIRTGRDLTKAKQIEMEGDIPYIGSGKSSVNYVNEYIVDDMFILTGRVGTIGDIKLYSGKYWINGNAHYLLNENKLILKYVYYFLKFNNFQIIKRMKGSDRGRLNIEDLKEVEYPNPTSEIQNKTVENLDYLDAQKKMFEELKEGIIKRMRLYLETQIKKNDTEIVKLGEVCEINDKKFKKRNTNYAKTEILEYNFYTGSANDKFYVDKYDIEGPIIIINRTNGSGKCNIKYGKKCSIAKQTHILSSENNIKLKYIYYLLNLNKNIIEKGYIGANHKNLSSTFLEEMNIITNISEQEIVEYLDDLENKKNSFQQEIEKIDIEMKDILEQSYQ